MRPLRIALLVYAAAFAALASAGPIKHDQRQDGEVNVRADLENFVIVIVPTSQSSASGLLDLLRNAIPSIKAAKLKPGLKTAHRVRENGGDESTKHFIESKSAAPYHVDLTPTKDGLAKLRPANVEQEQRITSENGEILIAHSPVVSLKHLHGHRPRAARSVDVAEKKRVVDAHAEPTKRENVAKTGGARVQLLNRRSVNIFADVSAENGLHSIEVGGGDDDDDATANVSENVVAARDESESDEANLIVGSVEEFDSNSIKKNDVDEMDTKDELLLLGAENEQCGPDRRRDSEGVCRFVDGNEKK